MLPVSQKGVSDPPLYMPSPLESATSAAKNSFESKSTICSAKLRDGDRAEGATPELEEENNGEKVTRMQQAMILIAVSLQAFTTIGYTQSFGIFQAHYGREAAVKDGIIRSSDITERAGIAAIGSLGNGGIIGVFSILSYPWLPFIGRKVKLVCFIGTLLMSIGLATASASTNLSQLIATQGVLVGLGSGIIQYTLTPILTEYFHGHSGLAQGITLAVAGGGGGIFSVGTRELLQAIGTKKTLGTLAAIHFVLNGIVSAIAQRPRKFETRRAKIVGYRTFKEPIFTLMIMANFIHPLTVAIPMTFGPDFSESLGFNAIAASFLLAMSSLVGIPTRLGIGFLADRCGHQNMVLLGTAIFGLSIWTLWIPAVYTSSKALWIAFTVCYGIVNGCFMTLGNSVQKELFGPNLYFSYSGAFTTVRGIGYVLGVPIAGALVKRVQDSALQPPDFTGAVVYTGSLVTMTGICLAIVRLLDAKKNGWKLVR